MKALGLKFRLDDLTSAGRAIEGNLTKGLLEESLAGLLGPLGYRAIGEARIEGTAYRSGAGEVIVDAETATKVGFDCSRCLESRSLEVSTKGSYVLVQKAPDIDGSAKMTLNDDDDDDAVESFEGDEIDLDELFRQELLLTLPMNPSCADAQQGDCEPVEVKESADPSDGIDPRWAPLLELKKNLK